MRRIVCNAGEEVRGSVEPWLMARWKARVEFLLSVIELLFLSLTVEALQGRMCQYLLTDGHFPPLMLLGRLGGVDLMRHGDWQ